MRCLRVHTTVLLLLLLVLLCLTTCAGGAATLAPSVVTQVRLRKDVCACRQQR